MPREITTHHTNTCNRAIEIRAHGPGPGGATLRYDISGFDAIYHRDRDIPYEDSGYLTEFQRTTLMFQEGNPAAGVNGITNEVLLALLIDRLEGFQSGPFRSDYNDLALSHARECLHVLANRTTERTNRGVEGQLVP